MFYFLILKEVFKEFFVINIFIIVLQIFVVDFSKCLHLTFNKTVILDKF